MKFSMQQILTHYKAKYFFHEIFQQSLKFILNNYMFNSKILFIIYLFCLMGVNLFEYHKVQKNVRL